MSKKQYKTDEPHYELPSSDVFREVGELPIKDEYGKEVPFKSLYEGKNNTQHLIIFLRHFFCTNCEDYVRALSQDLPPSVLHTTTPVTKVTLIGCGDIAPIPSYRTRTMHSMLQVDTHYSIFADPHRKIYEKLGMMQNLQGGDTQPAYVKKGIVEQVTEGVKNAVLSGTKALSGGHPAQNGGEMLVVNGEVVWFKRMRHTQDHAEISELKEVIGLK